MLFISLLTHVLFLTLESELHTELVSVLLLPQPQHLALCLAHSK